MQTGGLGFVPLDAGAALRSRLQGLWRVNCSLEPFELGLEVAERDVDARIVVGTASAAS